MDIKFTEEQEMIRQSARNFLTKKCPSSLVREMAQDEKGYTDDLWRGMAELGWMGLIFPEEYGGNGGSFLDLMVLLEEMGRVCLPGPFFSTVVLGGLTILEAGTQKQKEELLPQISSGEKIVTLALTEADSYYTPSSIAVTAKEDRGSYKIKGTKLFVPDAHVADRLLCVARTKREGNPEGGITLFVIDKKTPGIRTTLLQTISGEKLCEVGFDNVEVLPDRILGKAGEGWLSVKKVLQKAALGLCAQMVGGGQQILEMAVSYAGKREQFGKLIGSFQAIQHHCVNMLVDLDGCRWITYKTAWMMDEAMPDEAQVAMAKAWCNEAYKRVVALGHQVFGGIGYCEEHEMPLYFRRARISEVTFGDTDFHRKVVADHLFR